MALGVVEQVSGVWVADIVESQGAMNIGIEGANYTSISNAPPVASRDGGSILTDMTGWDFDGSIRLVAQDHGVAVGVHRRPACEENCVSEHGLDPFPVGLSLLVEKKSGGHRRAFGVPDNGIKGAALLHDSGQVFERVVGAPRRWRDAFPHQFPHGVLRRLTIGKVSDPR